MPIRAPAPPAAAHQALGRTLDRLRLSGQLQDGEPTLSAAIGGAPRFTSAQQVYVLGLESLANDEGLEACRTSGWRYLTDRGAGTVSAELAEDGQGGFTMAAVTEGPLSDASSRLIEGLSDAPQLADLTYELRTLRIPGLPLEAVWLKAERDDDDRLVLVQPLADLEAGLPYLVDDILPTLRRLAAARLDFDDAAD